MENRCAWAGDDPLYRAYHDEEWGVPSFDDRHLFEMLTLEGAQAGLSWITILKKREGYRAAFLGFDVAAVAGFSPEDVEQLLTNPAIVRNRLKVTSTVTNAGAVLAVTQEVGSLARYLWSFEQSQAMSRALLRRGFRFVGPTICYALMQAVGMVNDHEVSCFRHAECARLGAAARADVHS